MTSSKRFTVVFLVALSACAASAEDEDPTSVAALHKAPPFAYGTTCTRVERSSYGSSRTLTKTPLCLANADCGSSGGSSSSAFGAGLEWNGSMTFEDVKYFEGTCQAKTM